MVLSDWFRVGGLSLMVGFAFFRVSFRVGVGLIQGWFRIYVGLV